MLNDSYFRLNSRSSAKASQNAGYGDSQSVQILAKSFVSGTQNPSANNIPEYALQSMRDQVIAPYPFFTGPFNEL